MGLSSGKFYILPDYPFKKFKNSEISSLDKPSEANGDSEGTGSRGVGEFFFCMNFE